MGQGWGPEGWSGGGTSSGRRRLGAAKPAYTHSSSCWAACLCPQAEPCAWRGHLGVALEPRTTWLWSPQWHCHHAALPETTPGDCGPRCRVRGEGPPRGDGEIGQTWGQRGKFQDWGSPWPLPAHCTSWSAWVCRDRDSVPLPVKCHCPRAQPDCPHHSPAPSVALEPTARAWGGLGNQLPTGRCLLKLQAEAVGRAGRRSLRVIQAQERGEIAPFQHQAAGQNWVEPCNPAVETPSSHQCGTLLSITLCPALCVGPTSTGSLPAAVSPCPAPHTLPSQLLSQLLL